MLITHVGYSKCATKKRIIKSRISQLFYTHICSIEVVIGGDCEGLFRRILQKSATRLVPGQVIGCRQVRCDGFVIGVIRTKATGNSRFETEKSPRQPKNCRKFPLLKVNNFPLECMYISLSVIMVCETVIKRMRRTD